MPPPSTQIKKNVLHRRRLWTPLTILPLGAWLITSPFTFGYQQRLLTLSDMISGSVLIVFSLISLHDRHAWARWITCLTGVWLQMAPLLFWAANPAAYVNDTLIGVWVIALSVLIPGLPGNPLEQSVKPDLPPGWSYNPSSWFQRMPVIVLGLIGWFMARYLAAYQLGYIDTAWDPFFGEGTKRVLESELSKSWPLSDAGLGAVSYTLEVLLAYVGGQARWRTAPWLVVFFGILVVPLGLTHVLLVISQPVVVGYWCTLCLATAVAMLFMIPQAVDEVIAVGQFLREKATAGRSFWPVFWKGGETEGSRPDTRTPSFDHPSWDMFRAANWGITFPVTLWLSSITGLWLMMSPSILSTPAPLSMSNQVSGALIITISVVVSAEVIRVGRYINALIGLWLMISPWILGAFDGAALIANVVAAILLIGATVPRGRVKERYGNWDQFIH